MEMKLHRSNLQRFARCSAAAKLGPTPYSGLRFVESWIARGFATSEEFQRLKRFACDSQAMRCGGEVRPNSVCSCTGLCKRTSEEFQRILSKTFVVLSCGAPLGCVQTPNFWPVLFLRSWSVESSFHVGIGSHVMTLSLQVTCLPLPA